jgi:hypothetical protein
LGNSLLLRRFQLRYAEIAFCDSFFIEFGIVGLLFFPILEWLVFLVELLVRRNVSLMGISWIGFWCIYVWF